MSAELAEARQVVLMDGLSFEGCRHLGSVADLSAGAWLNALLAIVLFAMVMSFRIFDTSLVRFQLLCRINPLCLRVGSPSVLGRLCGVGVVRCATMYPLNRVGAYS